MKSFLFPQALRSILHGSWSRAHQRPVRPPPRPPRKAPPPTGHPCSRASGPGCNSCLPLPRPSDPPSLGCLPRSPEGAQKPPVWGPLSPRAGGSIWALVEPRPVWQPCWPAPPWTTAWQGSELYSFFSNHHLLFYMMLLRAIHAAAGAFIHLTTLSPPLYVYMPYSRYALDRSIIGP